MVDARTTRLLAKKKQRLSLTRACWGWESSNLRAPHIRNGKQKRQLFGVQMGNPPLPGHINTHRGSSRAEVGGGGCALNGFGPHSTECRPDLKAEPVNSSWCNFSPEIPKEGSPLSWVELLKLALHPSSSSRKHRALSTMTLHPAKRDNVFLAQHPSFPIEAPQLGRSDGEEDAQMESGWARLDTKLTVCNQWIHHIYFCVPSTILGIGYTPLTKQTDTAAFKDNEWTLTLSLWKSLDHKMLNLNWG